MTDRFWKKADSLFGLIPIMAIFGILVVGANIEIKDLDLWLHIAMGKFITQHGYVPGTDVLSCSIAGHPWINHEWLFQVIVYNIYRGFGADGLILMQVIIVSCTMLLLLFLGYSKNRQLIITILLFLLLMIYQQRFTIRPDLFSLLFFSVYIFVLALHIDKKWSLPLLFVVQVIWSNMHGFFFFGPLFVLIGIVSEWIRRHVRLPYEWNESGRLTDAEYRRGTILFFVVVLACVFNPMFVKGAWYPVSVFFSLSGENKIFFQYIQELQKPITRQTLWDLNEFMYYKAMIGLSLISFIFNRRRIDISALFLWIVFLVFSLNARRNTAFFAIAAYLVIITNLLNINFKDIVPLRFSEKKFLYFTTIIAKAIFLVWIIAFYQNVASRSYYDFEKYELKSEYGGVSQRAYPNKAVDFLVEHSIKGNFFNDFNSGAYLLGRTFPDIKVFIDGRTEVYGGRFFQEYQEIWEKGDGELFERMVKRHHITGAFLNSSRQHIPKAILNYLYQQEDWHVVYFNYDAVIFLKEAEINREWIDRFRVDLTQWSALPIDLYKLGTLRVKPYQSYYRAYSLESLGLVDQALSELEEAFGADPFFADAHDLAGKIYAGKGDYQKAFEHFRIAVTGTPHNKDMRFNLALAYYDLGKYKEAAKQYDRIIYLWPSDPRGYFLLTKTYIADGEFDLALDAFKQAQKAHPKAVGDLVELCHLLSDKKAYPQVLEAYTIVLDVDPDNIEILEKLGHVYLALGLQAQATETFQKALALAPENMDIQKALEKIAEQRVSQ